MCKGVIGTGKSADFWWVGEDFPLIAGYDTVLPELLEERPPLGDVHGWHPLLEGAGVGNYKHNRIVRLAMIPMLALAGLGLTGCGPDFEFLFGSIVPFNPPPEQEEPRPEPDQPVEEPTEPPVMNPAPGPAEPVLGDLNGDGVVSGLDADAFTDAFGASVGSADYLPEADFDDDGTITLLDFETFRQLLLEAEGM